MQEGAYINSLAATAAIRILKRRISYIEFFIVTGVLSFLTALVLFIVKRGVDDWLTFILLFLLPSFFTIASFLYILNERCNNESKKLSFTVNIVTKVAFIVLSILLLLFQLFIISAWVAKGTNKYFPALLHFYGYFMLVGSVCTFTFLYRLTDTNKKVATTDAANTGF